MKAKRADTPEIDEEILELANAIAEWTWDLKALNTVVIDLRGRVSYTDFVIVTTGTSERHVQAIARQVEQRVGEETGRQTYGMEGVDGGRWALVDFGDVILHVFNGPERQDYDLERMWPDAPRLELADKPKELYGHFELEEFGGE